jgi:hypothetical protein
MSTSLENILYNTTTSGIDVYPQGTEALYIIFNNDNPLQQPSVFDTGGMSMSNNYIKPLDYYGNNQNEQKPWSLTKWDDDCTIKPIEPQGYQYIHRPEMFDTPVFNKPSIFDQPNILQQKPLCEPIDLGCNGYKITKWEPEPIKPTYYGLPESKPYQPLFDNLPSPFTRPTIEPYEPMKVYDFGEKTRLHIHENGYGTVKNGNDFLKGLDQQRTIELEDGLNSQGIFPRIERCRPSRAQWEFEPYKITPEPLIKLPSYEPEINNFGFPKRDCFGNIIMKKNSW